MGNMIKEQYQALYFFEPFNDKYVFFVVATILLSIKKSVNLFANK